MLKVLLVEDEDIIRRGLKFKMDWTEAGCVVAGEAASGKEGLEKIQEIHPDIVITDIRMPDMDGLEMLKRGREICPFHAVIISGYGEFEYAQQAISLRVAEYLLKPIDLNELKICLKKIADQCDENAAESGNEYLPVPEIDVSNVHNKYAEEMLRFIQAHYAERISITDISQKLNVSCTHLNTKFKAETGHTFNDFLNYYRISKAIEYQKDGQLKMYEIAELVGFSDYKYFNKVYKKYVGCSPNNFK